jgi:hypothetical protein
MAEIHQTALMKAYPQDKYFASLSGMPLAAAVMDRATMWYQQLPRTLNFFRMTKMYNCYFGLPGDFDPFDVTQVGNVGTQGRLASIRVSHLGSIGRTMVRMTTENPPEFEPTSVNSDTDSDEQAILAKQFLGYLLDTKNLAQKCREALETGVVMGDGPLLIQWDPAIGTPQFETTAPPQSADGAPPPAGAAPPAALQKKPILLPNGKQKRAGDYIFTNLTPLDTITDVTKKDRNHDWMITRVYVNKWDYIVRYPEWEQQLKDAKDQRWPGFQTNTMETERQYVPWMTFDWIPIYILWHRRSEALPNGKYAVVLDADLPPLIEGDLPYSKIPVVNFSPGHIFNTAYGTSDLHLGLGLSDLMESTYSAIASNNLAFGLQLIASPRTADYGLTQLTDGLNLINFDTDPNLPNGGLPVGINLHKESPSSMPLVDHIIRDLETITGINAVSRGQPPSTDASGALAALIQQQSITQTSPLMVAWTQGIEDVGNLCLEMMNAYGAGQQLAAIVGNANQYVLLDFQGGPDGDLSKIKSVTVKSGNPAKKSEAQKIQLLQIIAQAKGAQVTVKDLISVYETGDVEENFEAPEAFLMQLRSENEQMRKGVNPPVLPTDNHAMHIDEMLAVLNSPAVRGQSGQAVAKAALDHLNDHMRIWAQMSIDNSYVLFATHQQPMPLDVAKGVPGVQLPPPPPMPPPPPSFVPTATMEPDKTGGLQPKIEWHPAPPPPGAPGQPGGQPPPSAPPGPPGGPIGHAQPPSGLGAAPPVAGQQPSLPQMPKVAGTQQRWAPGHVAKP